MQGLILQVITAGNVNGDETVNIFDLVIVAGNFSKSLVFAPSVTAEIELSTDQKRHIAHAIDKLESNPNCSMVLHMFLQVNDDRYSVGADGLYLIKGPPPSLIRQIC